MQRIEDIEDRMNGVATYEFANGKRIKLDAKSVERYGVEQILRDSGFGYLLPTGRVDVIQDGRRIGTVPATFDPASIKSTSFFYDPRAGDFKRDGDKWVAASMLGPGDLEAIPTFVWNRN
jgi:hypothetical protein